MPLFSVTFGAPEAGAAPTLPAIDLTYRGGPLLQNVKPVAFAST